jgi:predicted RNA-binding Zn ribbon-like protein
VTYRKESVTGQVELDSYIDAGVFAAVGLVNSLTKGHAHGRPTGDIDALAAIKQVLAVDPPSVAAVKSRDTAGFGELAEQLRSAFQDLDRGQVDAAARRLNTLLARHPASPHLAKEDGIWRLHHHPADAPLLPMWTSICAEALARMIGAQAAHRLGVCNATSCDRVFVDTTRNASRRFCSVACQNRTKTAAFRQRQA